MAKNSMIFDGSAEEGGNLPALPPDLVVARVDGHWEVTGLSPRLAVLGGVSPEGGAARFEGLFGDTVPPLPELAAEVLEREDDLDAIPVRFSGGETLEADVRYGGLTENFLGRTVLFRFRRPAVEEGRTLFGICGTGPAMREVFRKIALYAAADAAVVITGETGTGKELVARALHDAGSRHQGPYVAVNCSAISEELLESELFGHEKGAFTGAVRTHRGRFERADKGTLFLDEIGDMPLHTQAKLLRVLEEQRVERVGGEREMEVDVRVVAATNVSLERAVAEGRFRADLYHRLSVLRIHLPPLRERTEDIPLLVSHFLKHFNRRYGKQIERLTPEALALLRSYLWPGNVRELRNVLERVYIETQAEVIGARAFAEWIRERRDFAPGEWGPDSSHPANSIAPPYPLNSDRPLIAQAGSGYLEAELVPDRRSRRTTRPAELDVDELRRAYRAAEGNLSATARLLGVHRATLYRYMQKLGIERGELEG